MLQRNTIVGMCCLVAAGAAIGAGVVSEPFATATDDIVADGTYNADGIWSGYGSVTNREFAIGYANAVGAPISGTVALPADNKILSINGYVQCTKATEDKKPASVDMLVQIVKPDEALEMPTEEAGNPVQIAVGVDTDGALKVWTAGKGTEAGWKALPGTYEEDSWHRITFVIDYAKGTCQILVDGNPQVSADGYLTSDPAKDATVDGSWYKINLADATKINSLKIVGMTAIDELVVKSEETVTDATPAIAGTTTVDELAVANDWIAKQGIAMTAEALAATAPDGSEMTVAQKYLVGLDVTDGEKFVMKKMAMSTVDGVTKVKITHPKFSPQSGKKVKISYGATAEATGATVEISSGAEETEIALPSGNANVLCYKLIVE